MEAGARGVVFQLRQKYKEKEGKNTITYKKLSNYKINEYSNKFLDVKKRD